MNELKVLGVATLGGLFLQSMEPLPDVVPTDTPQGMLMRMLISVAGGIISTVAYQLVQLVPWKKLAGQIIKKQKKQKPLNH
jgi:hypothetical protein